MMNYCPCMVYSCTINRGCDSDMMTPLVTDACDPSKLCHSRLSFMHNNIIVFIVTMRGDNQALCVLGASTLFVFSSASRLGAKIFHKKQTQIVHCSSIERKTFALLTKFFVLQSRNFFAKGELENFLCLK